MTYLEDDCLLRCSAMLFFRYEPTCQVCSFHMVLFKCSELIDMTANLYMLFLLLTSPRNVLYLMQPTYFSKVN